MFLDFVFSHIEFVSNEHISYPCNVCVNQFSLNEIMSSNVYFIMDLCLLIIYLLLILKVQYLNLIMHDSLSSRAIEKILGFRRMIYDAAFEHFEAPPPSSHNHDMQMNNLIKIKEHFMIYWGKKINNCIKVVILHLLWIRHHN